MLFLILMSLIVASGFLIAYLWAVKNGQFDDDYTPSVRMLFDDDFQSELPSETGVENNKITEEVVQQPTG